MEDFKPKLRGNTFLILLLRAAKEEVSARPTWNKQASGLTRAKLFDSLIRVMAPSQKVQNISTLTKYLPEYLEGERPNSKTCYPFNDARFITRVRNRFNSKGALALTAMKKFCDDYLNMDSSNLEFLLGGIIGTALEDDSFNGMFFTGSKWLSKDSLKSELVEAGVLGNTGSLKSKPEYNLQAFLLSVWYYILTVYNNAGDAHGAYSAWTDQSNLLTVKTTIGDTFLDKIRVNIDDVSFIKFNAKSSKSSVAPKDNAPTDAHNVSPVSPAHSSDNSDNPENYAPAHHVAEDVNSEHIAKGTTQENTEQIINRATYVTQVNANSVAANTKLAGSEKIKPVVRNGDLNFEYNERYLLEDCDVQDYVKTMNPPPGRLMILSLYFITLEYNGEYYVVLDYTSYVHRNGSDGYKVNNGMWTVPHTSIYVESRRAKPTTIKEVIEEYDNVKDQSPYADIMRKGQEELLYTLGLLNTEAHNPEEGREYIEYKESHTTAGEMRCFKIREFFIHGIQDDGLLNLIDPEGIHKHYIVPLSLIQSLKPVDGIYYFMGRPMPHNISDVFIEPQNLGHLLSCVNKVQHSDLFAKVRGILFVISISGAANIYREIKDRYVAGLVEQIIPLVLEKCMIEFNVRYYSADKSQVIGIMPEDHLDFTEMLERLFVEITDILIESSSCIALRCTALSCECLYGKILGLCDSKRGFAGEGYEKLCRMADETSHVQWHSEEAFNGILLGWDVKDKIHFDAANSRMSISDRLNKDSRTMKFKVVSKKHYVEAKRREFERTPDSGILYELKQKFSQLLIEMSNACLRL